MSMRVGFAALDLGTSRLRAGVFEDGSHPRLHIIADRPNAIRIAPGGVARCSFNSQWNAIRELMGELGEWSRGSGIQHLHLGLCGQVSSLLRWDNNTQAPADDDYAIWMDSTCQDALADTARFWNHGGAERMLGTCMPAVTTWLAVKARDHALRHPHDRSTIFQVQDATFLRLTGERLTHPSSQTSLVHQHSWTYSAEVLKFAGLSPDRLPELAPKGMARLLSAIQREAGLPDTTVHSGLMDTHAAFFGLFPEHGDGLLLTGTSEVLGVFESWPREQAPARMVRARLGEGWLVYGSSSSGGASVRWLMTSLLGRNLEGDLERLTKEAASIAPGSDGLNCMPYFGGERAPLWNSEATGSFLGLRTHHRDAHLLRALFEGIAFTRRQAAEALECPMPARFLMAGGGAANGLWNSIRAAVLNRPLEVMEIGELALIGSIRHAMTSAGIDTSPLRKLLHTMRVEPDAAMAASYQPLYSQFLANQNMLGIGITRKEEAHA